jgi:hypothetical protein
MELCTRLGLKRAAIEYKSNRNAGKRRFPFESKVRL